MKQHLRSLWTLLLLMMWCSVGLAQTITADFTNSIPSGWSKTGTTVKHKDYGTQLQKSTSVTSPAFTETISTITINLTRSSNGTTFSIGYIKDGKTTVFKTFQKNNVTQNKLNDYDVDVPKEAQVSGVKFVFTSAKASYYIKTITFTPGVTKTKTTLTFPEQAISINGGDEASFKGQSAKLYAGEQELTGKTIKYAYTDDDIFATFDGTTGAATLKSGVYGTATVTATYAGDDTYAKAEASYTVKIVDPNFIVLDAKADKGTASSMGKDDAIEKGNIILTGTDIALKPNADHYKIYSKGYFTISAKEGVITKITINCTGANKQDYGPGNFSSDIEGYSFKDKVGTWEGNATSVKFTNNATKQVQVTSIEITIKNKVITLDENLNNTISEEKGVTVKTVRTLVANKWNTFCVPFETEIAGTALEGATVKAVGEIVGNVINLVAATKIEAGVPYLVMPTTGDIVNPTFKNVTINATTPVEKGNDEYKFVGTYSPKKITVDEFGKIWGVTAEGKLAKINADTTMKGLRAYFVFPTNTPAAKLNFDGETTGINNIKTNATVNGKVYNLNGQYVGNSLNGLKKGIYVVNGKKVIK